MRGAGLRNATSRIMFKRSGSEIGATISPESPILVNHDVPKEELYVQGHNQHKKWLAGGWEVVHVHRHR